MAMFQLLILHHPHQGKQEEIHQKYQFQQHQGHNQRLLKVKEDMDQRNTGRQCMRCPNP